jgi:hypothetical protein
VKAGITTITGELLGSGQIWCDPPLFTRAAKPTPYSAL